jgi:hypothetical protein
LPAVKRFRNYGGGAVFREKTAKGDVAPGSVYSNRETAIGGMIFEHTVPVIAGCKTRLR